ncbi:MAG TPA: AAA family ATPase [Holophaga sp.]|nr:AAA family ATPase [Holophaga sp.]
MSGVRFGQVRISEAPGFHPGEYPGLDSFAPGLNVVWGPNGTGKTTLANALRGLLWKDRRDSLRASASLVFEEGPWTAARSGRELAFRDETRGLAATAAPWGQEGAAEQYWFSLHDLLASASAGETFARQVEIQLDGGISLEAAQEAAGGAARPIHEGHAAFTLFSAAESAFKAKRKEMDDNQDLERQLAEQRAIHEKARLAAEGLAPVQNKLALLRDRARLQELERTLEGFPGAMPRLGATDPDLVAGLEAQAGEAEAARLRLEGDRDGKAAALRSLPLPAHLHGDAAGPDSLEPLIAALEGALEGHRAAEALRIGREGAEKGWRDQHAWLFQGDPETRGLEQALGSLRALAEDCEPRRTAWDAAQRFHDLLPAEAPDPGRRERLGTARTRLEDWLQAGEAAQARRLVPPGLLLAALALALGALLLAAWGNPAGRLGAGILFLAAAAVPLSRLRGGAAQEGPRASALAALEPFPALRPAAWTREGVLASLERLAAEAGRLDAALEMKARRDEARQRLDATREAFEAWAARWKDAVAALGLSPSDPALGRSPFFHFAQSLRDWTLALAELEAARSAETAARARLDRADAALRASLAQSGFTVPPGEPAALAARAREIQDGWRRASALLAEVEEIDRRIEVHQDQARALAARIARFWSDRGYPAPDPQALARDVARIGEWNLLVAQARDLRGRVLDQEADLGRLDRGEDAEALEARRAALEREAAKATAAFGEIQRIEGRLDSLRRGRDLEQRMKELAEARHRKRQAILENMEDLAVTRIVARLQRIAGADQPEVVALAETWLRRFTGDRYRLHFRREAGFVVHDAVKGRAFRLEELSSGTRVQLLMAVRLGFIERTEGPAGARLPVFLDEALANSDDERSQAIVQALVEIARDRQVFYFTARLWELEAIRDAAGPQGFNLVSLDQAALRHAQAQAPRKAVAGLRRTLPDPALDFEAYAAACGGWEAELFVPLDRLHISHLFARTEELHPHVARNRRTLGQLRLGPGEEDATLAARHGLLLNAQAYAKRGRGRPFGPEDLEAAARDLGIKKEVQYWESLAAAVEACGGDAYRFRSLLPTVKRLGAKAGALEEWLELHEHTVPGEALDATAILDLLHEANPWLRVDSDDHAVVARYLDAVLGG